MGRVGTTGVWWRPRRRWLRSVRLLRLQPGDALVIETEMELTMEQANAIRAGIAAEFPGHTVLVLNNLRLAVVRLGGR